MGIVVNGFSDMCPSRTKTHAWDSRKEQKHAKRADIELYVRVSHFYGAAASEGVLVSSFLSSRMRVYREIPSCRAAAA